MKENHFVADQLNVSVTLKLKYLPITSYWFQGLLKKYRLWCSDWKTCYCLFLVTGNHPNCLVIMHSAQWETMAGKGPVLTTVPVLFRAYLINWCTKCGPCREIKRIGGLLASSKLMYFVFPVVGTHVEWERVFLFVLYIFYIISMATA